MTRAAVRRKTSFFVSVVMVTLMTATISRTNTLGSNIPLALVRAFTKQSLSIQITSRVQSRTYSPKTFPPTTLNVHCAPLLPREGAQFYARKTTATLKASNIEEYEDEIDANGSSSSLDNNIIAGDSQTTAAAATKSASTEADTPFEKLFQSTLQRAYSTTATLGNIKDSIDFDATPDDPQDNSRTNRNSVNVSAAMNSILDATVVERTTEDSIAPNREEDKEAIASTVNSVLDATIVNIQDKYSRRTETKKQRQTQEHHSKKNDSSSRYEFPFATSYKSHPALNNVALAHALWASVVRPNADTIIDATCGNGNDSIVLAEILFKNENNDDTPSELLCLDVQLLACKRTTEALREVLPPSIRVIGPEAEDDSGSNKVVRVLNASHERLPRPANPVGLIVYNLGWLPGTDNSDGKDCVTTMETTIASMVDAIGLFRVGGMLSVITYPQTGPDEDTAVRLFFTCLGLLSSRTRTWQEEIEDFSGPAAVATVVKSAMEVVPKNQTWRVSQHDKLGMDRPPVLFTATRIK